MRKVLVSPGYNTGWSTAMWCRTPEQWRFATEYQPLIDHIEAVGKGNHSLSETHPLVEQFALEFNRMCRLPDHSYLNLLGASSLMVASVPDGVRYQVREYDGSEHLELESDQMWL